MLKNLLKKVPGVNLQDEVANLHAISDRAVAVFGDMILDLGRTNEKLGELAVKADVVADEHIAMAVQARSKMQKNQDIMDNITKIMA